MVATMKPIQELKIGTYEIGGCIGVREDCVQGQGLKAQERAAILCL